MTNAGNCQILRFKAPDIPELFLFTLAWFNAGYIQNILKSYKIF